nr:MAG TPA: Thermospermine synthase ACAULIS protein biosynthesis, tetraamine, thermospermine, spermidine [Bacteriophage sp.]
MSMYKDMTSILKDGQVGDFKLQHYEISDNNFYAIVRCGIPSGIYVRLINRGECVMSDTPMEKETNRDFVRNAHGNVLIGGLGIGLIILAIQDKEDVKQITVVEKNREVIELVGKQLPLNPKVNIVNDDVFEYKPLIKYNTIYMDIWNYINEDVYNKQMKPLIKRYRKYLVPKAEDENRYIDCWCKRQAKNGERI